MATSINKVTILGILGQDPEIKTVNGKKINAKYIKKCQFNLIN